MPRSATWAPEVVKEIRNRPFPSLDHLVIIPAQLHGPAAVDRYRESIDTRVVIGAGLPRPLVLETPLFIPAMSFGAISKAGKMAFAYGAARMGTATNSGGAPAK